MNIDNCYEIGADRAIEFQHFNQNKVLLINQNKYTCDHCGQTYKYRESLKKHNLTYHNSYLSPTNVTIALLATDSRIVREDIRKTALRMLGTLAIKIL